MNQDTICAIATAQGGAIGTIRVSGPEAISITSRIFQPAKAGKVLSEQKPYTLTFGSVYEGDEVLVSLFRAPHSYTGEDSTEITCHGSTYILQKVMQLLLKEGCRLAQPGEYTQRAFLNGKMDLSQAEAVADLIASSSAATHPFLAMSRDAGGRIQPRKADLTAHQTPQLPPSMIELELDFSEEDVEFADRTARVSWPMKIEHVISRLVHSFSVGNAIKNGVPVAIIGETNAGKSTLLNVLLNEEKAIVSDIHGTTRDVIEDTVNLGGITFRFIDTAGIRDTDDTIESLGIERTFQKLDQAEIVLWMVDASQATEQLAQLSGKIIPRCEDKHLIVVFNKADLMGEEDQARLADLLSGFPAERTEHILISAKQRIHTQALEELLVRAAHLPSVTQNDIIVTNVRHYEALSHALDAIHRVQQGLDLRISGDFLSQDIRECIFYISDIAGEVTNDMVCRTSSSISASGSKYLIIKQLD